MLTRSLALVFLAGLGAPLAAQDFAPGDIVLAVTKLDPTRGALAVLDPDGRVRESLSLPVVGGLYPHLATALEYTPDQGLLVVTAAGRFGQDGEVFAAGRRAPHALHSQGSIFDFGVSAVNALARDAGGRLYLANGDFQATSCCPYTQALRVFTPALELRDTFELEVGDLPYGVAALAVRPDGSELVYSTGAPEVRRYDLEARAALPSLALPEQVVDLVWLGAGDEFLVAGAGAHVWHLDTSGNTLATYAFPGEFGRELALDLDGRSFLLATRRELPAHVRPADGAPFLNVLRRIDLATGATLLHRRLPDGYLGDLTVVEREKLRQR